MAAKVKSVWGVDVGNNCLKAIRLRSGVEGVEVAGVSRIEHSKSLLTEGIDDQQKQDIIAETLRKFVDQNSITKADEVAISVPGQSSLARFINLPPVDPKGIPKIVQYEAVQQIPFDINEVEWDWQIMEKPDSPEAEVGIFAIKNELINSILEPYQQENLKITTVQMGPMALYNYACHEFTELDDMGTKAIILLNMGSESTELVVCSKTKVWQRVIPIGGNNFTQAIADAFKIPFEKAEGLKRKAPMSKYAKQIFHAMRPVFTDMGSEIQRSVGYFSSQSRGVKFVKVIALGGAMKLQGVAKYLQQSLQIPVIRPETYEGIAIGSDVSAASVHEDIGDLGTAYGLAIQGVGQAKISSNLLPRRIARSMAWARKAQVMLIAAGILLAVSLLSFGKAVMDKKSYDRSENIRKQTQRIISSAQDASRKLKTQQSRQETLDAKAKDKFEMFKYRDTIVNLKQTILKCFPNAENNPAQASLYSAFNEGNVEEIVKTPRKDRKQMFITSMKISYAKDLKSVSFGSNTTTKRSPKRGRSTRSKNPTGQFGAPMPPGQLGLPMDSGSSKDEDKEAAGFVVEIEGYSPYGDIDKIMDPYDAGKDKSKWGVITWLKNINEVVDGNSAFEILNAKDTKHFLPETGLVDLNAEMPLGIGKLARVKRAEKLDSESARDGRTGSGKGIIYEEEVLLDPLTGEEISRTYVLDDDSRIVLDNYDQPQYNDNDSWFIIKAKFVWKDTMVKKVESDNKPKGRRDRRNRRAKK